MAIVTQSTSQISPANERMYHQSNLLGEWKGNWAGNNQAVGFKVVNIRGTRAQVEYITGTPSAASARSTARPSPSGQ